jgi:hypothetical protein
VLAEVEVRALSVAGNVVTAHQGMRITRAWKFSRQDWVDLAIHAAGPRRAAKLDVLAAIAAQ